MDEIKVTIKKIDNNIITNRHSEQLNIVNQLYIDNIDINTVDKSELDSEIR